MIPESSLNSEQLAAVKTTDGPLLILAGAGSGKTRVLTYRIANLIYSGAALPGEIFAVTFTNKAAKEMLHRVSSLLVPQGIPVHELWISTFHSSGAKILRTYGSAVGLEPGFTILDDSDQLTLIKHCMTDLGINDKMIAPKAVQHRINQLKNDAINPRDYTPVARSFMETKLVPIMKAYEDGLRKNNSVDFGDLLLKTYELMRDHESIRRAFQDRYRYLLVDEYQDTNAVQYKFLRLLAEKHGNICVVGDEDQCIYKWRGADIRNILDFEKDYPNARVVKLEENYRSTGHIIRAASGVIAHNTERKEKTLFTENVDGEPVEVHSLENDIEESRWVGQSLRQHLDLGRSPRDIAIFYRTNAQSRLFEDVLRINRVAYRVFGGLKFYDRAEIKDSLSYMRLFVNPRDDLALTRVINVPTRGIGRTTIDALRAFAVQESCSLLEAAGRAVRGEGDLGAAARKKIDVFLQLYAKLAAEATRLSPREFYGLLLDETGYIRSLKDEATIEAETRIENLEELGTALAEYENRSEDPTLAGFLEEVALVTDADKADPNEPALTLMTIHSAKGLEFPIVYLVGLEEELFPSARSIQADADGMSVEEERRLCYVGMTRARERLYMTWAKIRRVFGITHVRSASRFLKEIPEAEVRTEDHAPHAFARRANMFDNDFGDSFVDAGSSFGGAFEQEEADGFEMGSKVSHPDFGEGKIVRREGRGEGLKVSVAFDRWGTKKFLVKFAPLERLG
ncbi:MAG: UvrD-helicase domain-containing protein [Bdellovibrionales bacterium]|nr:UvrD-helicase domain-containing protein [Bdellovibrionales bacterium]